MSSFDAHAIAAAIPLLLEAEKHTPHWVQFATDDDARMFSRMLSFLVRSSRSPMVDQWQTERAYPRPYVIQWKTISNEWCTGITYRDEDGHRTDRIPVRNDQGERLGRLRFRAQASGGAR